MRWLLLRFGFGASLHVDYVDCTCILHADIVHLSAVIIFCMTVRVFWDLGMALRPHWPLFEY